MTPAGSAAAPPLPDDGRDPEGRRLRACVRRARNGDREAFAELYRRYAGLVNAILLARLPASEVPDLVQDVFLKAMRKLPTLRDPGAFAPWLATLARRAAAEQYRRGRSRLEHPMEEPPAPATRPALTAEGLAVLQALTRLPETYRETLLLWLVEGLSGREIASATGLTEGSVRVNLTRGMRRLRAALEGTDDQ